MCSALIATYQNIIFYRVPYGYTPILLIKFFL
jgi:hypothetical protein